MIHYQCSKLPFPLHARDWLQRAIFKKLDNGDLVLVFRTISEKEEDVPEYKRSTMKPPPTRGDFNGYYYLERLPNDCTKLSYIAKADIRGSVPKVVAESGLRTIVSTVETAYEFFERDEEVSNCHFARAHTHNDIFRSRSLLTRCYHSRAFTLWFTQIDKFERDKFVRKIKSDKPPTQAEQFLLSKSLEHVDMRLNDALCLVENSSEMRRIPSSTKKKNAIFSRRTSTKTR